MDQQELLSGEQSPYDDTPYTFDRVRRYSRDEAVREHLENLRKEFKFELHENFKSTGRRLRTTINSEQAQNVLSNVCLELLAKVQSESENMPLRKEISYLEDSYNYVMEKFLQKMEKFLFSSKQLREDLESSVKKFSATSRLIAEVTVASSAVQIGLLVGNVLHKLFHVAWNSKVLYLETITGTVSITASLFALTYMRWSSAKISRDVSDESRSLMDLVVLHRKGNWIDEEVQKLFPYGIDTKLLENKGSNNRTFLSMGHSWRHSLCYAIILTNTQKDKKLLWDDIFLAKVRMFVRSHAANVWWNRRKITKLLEVVIKKVDSTSVKDITADYDVHFQKIALYLYPVMAPLLLNTWNSGRMKFLCSSFLFILAFYDLKTPETEDCEGLKKVLRNFETDFSEIKEICQSLDNEED